MKDSDRGFRPILTALILAGASLGSTSEASAQPENPPPPTPSLERSVTRPSVLTENTDPRAVRQLRDDTGMLPIIVALVATGGIIVFDRLGRR